MIAEIGLLCLIASLLCSILLVIVPSVGLWKKQENWQKAAPHYVVGQFIFITFAYFCLSICFLQDDFSVTYVLNNSSLALPWFYKLCAVWGGHEGSMLLWVAILSLWTLGVALTSTQLASAIRTRVLVVLGFLSFGFILFLLMTSNPFARQFTILASAGRDLNPLLQDPGFLFHPPMLYMGYVGFSIAFAFAIAALWAGRIDPAWTKWTRPWTLAAWCCLTLGITLGSWWAYRELGWGGWWFWDPVENASFMPWLVGTALLHSLAVSEQRRRFEVWTILLAIIAFSLSLVGTFLVRSGVLTSVHAFAVDPERGLYILIFLLVVIGGSLLLFACSSHHLNRTQQPSFVSRESALLLNNVFLCVVMLTILLGTIYPLIVDGLGLGKLSVGAPYFNAVFVPLMVPFLFLMGLGLHLRWKKDSWKTVASRLKSIGFISLTLPFILVSLAGMPIQFSVMMGLGLAFWIILSTLYALYLQIKRRGIRAIQQSFWGMCIAHIGVAATVLGISISTGYGLQEDVKMAPGTNIQFAGHRIDFIQQSKITGPNYRGTQAQFIVHRGARTGTIYPEKRLYTIAQMAMTESAIDVTPMRDLYVALGEPLGETAWSVRLYYKPMIRWIWGGGFMMLAGGLLALINPRYFRKRLALVVT